MTNLWSLTAPIDTALAEAGAAKNMDLGDLSLAYSQLVGPGQWMFCLQDAHCPSACAKVLANVWRDRETGLAYNDHVAFYTGCATKTTG